MNYYPILNKKELWPFEKLFNDFWKEDNQINNMLHLDIKEKENTYSIMANLPGIKKENLKITHNDNYLNIIAKQENEKEEKSEKYYCKERYSGNYQRSIQLPQNVDFAKIEANLDNGVLNIQIPKKEVETEKEIVVK